MNYDAIQAGAIPAKTRNTPYMRIQPSKGWVSLKFRELWDYRELFYFLTWRDIKVRYKQTALGAAWAIIAAHLPGRGLSVPNAPLATAGTRPVE